MNKLKNYFNDTHEISNNLLILLTSLFVIAFYNFAFFTNVTNTYPVNLENLGFLISLTLLVFFFHVFLLSLVCFKHTIKPVIIIMLLVSSSAAYFMDNYNVVINNDMIKSIFSTNMKESADLFSITLIFYFIALGVIPSYLIYKIKLSNEPFLKDVILRLKIILLSLVSIVVLILMFSDYYASFFRAHRELRTYANPSYYIYSAAKAINIYRNAGNIELKPLGRDAKVIKTDSNRKLLIFVVGETARADRFSLNGYERDTNPLLKQESIINFSNFWSCGTLTDISVPCMFSIYNANEFAYVKVDRTENALDIMQHAGINVLWLDNNSNSKGVADRVPFVDYQHDDINTVCDIECRDVGLLTNIQSHIDKTQGDIVIVLHQMGNHGPAYYKRYPKEFEKFSPACKTNELKNCTTKQINNAYDNAILYTDYFLSKTINLLKQNDDQFETAMFYVSDHGESLGENGLYLHGLPNLIAPDTQKHVSSILWLGKKFNDIDIKTVEMKKDNKFSHDNVFHTLLGLMEVKTSVYIKNMDILHN